MVKVLRVWVFIVGATTVSVWATDNTDWFGGFTLERTVAIVDMTAAGGVLYKLGHEDEAAKASVTPPIVQLYRRVAKYQTRFDDKNKALVDATALERTLLFITPQNTLTLNLGTGWLNVGEGYAFLNQEDYNGIRQLLKKQEKTGQVTPKEDIPHLVKALQADYSNPNKPLPFSGGMYTHSVVEAGDDAIVVEADTIVLTDEAAGKQNTEGQKNSGGTNSAASTGAPTGKSTKRPANSSGPKKVDKLVVRNQAPKKEDPTVYAKLAPGGKVVDKRKKTTPEKGDEVGEGGSGRLLQWVYSGGGVLAFIGFVIFLNQYANRKK